MKKVLVLASMLLMATISQEVKAQRINMVGSNGKTLDTIRNAATEYLKIPANALDQIGLAGKYDIKLVFTNDSGTSTATSILQSCMICDGNDWENHFGSESIGTNGIACDSLSISGSKVHTYHIEPGMVNHKDTNSMDTKSGRRLGFQLIINQAAGGRATYKGACITSN